MTVMTISFAAATGHTGMERRLCVGGLFAWPLRLRRLLAILMTCAGTANARRVQMFLRHVSGPVDSPGSSCFERCSLAALVPSDFHAGAYDRK
jgi:hypothetical protein